MNVYTQIHVWDNPNSNTLLIKFIISILGNSLKTKSEYLWSATKYMLKYIYIGLDYVHTWNIIYSPKRYWI